MRLGFLSFPGVGRGGSDRNAFCRAQQTDVQSFDIAPQPLSSALLAFAEQSGLEVLFDARVAQDQTSPGLRGSYTQEQALQRLLAGSGLSFRYVSANSVTLERPVAEPQSGPLRLSDITVTARRTEEMIQDVPGSVVVLDSEELGKIQHPVYGRSRLAIAERQLHRQLRPGRPRSVDPRDQRFGWWR